MCQVVAEISTVHLGNFDRAKKLIGLAHSSGAHYAKFQKRNPLKSVPEKLWNQPHPNSEHAYGKTYLEHRYNLELSIAQHYELLKFCKQLGIGYACSVWDVDSANEIISLSPEYIKVGSPSNQNFDLLHMLYSKFKGDIHISLGMSSKQEIQNILNIIDTKRTVLYHCTSEYPCNFDRLFLKEIQLLKNRLPNVRIGFSNHGFGIAADIAAYVLGAEWIERHFVDDRTLKHTDAAASLEPDGLRRLCRDLANVSVAMQYKNGITEGEQEQRKKLRV